MPNSLVDLAKEQERRQSALDARAKDVRRADAGAEPPAQETMLEVQQRYDETYQSIGLPGAPPPLQDESLPNYSTRLCSELQPYCSDPMLQSLNLYEMPSSERQPFEQQIIADAGRAVEDRTRGDWADPSRLREVIRTDESGRSIHEFMGSPNSWVDELSGPAIFVKRFMTKDGADLPNNRKNVGFRPSFNIK